MNTTAPKRFIFVLISLSLVLPNTLFAAIPHSSTLSLSAHYAALDREGITRSTITDGIYAIDDMPYLNHNLETASQITKDKQKGGLNANLTLDTRVFSEEGRQQIAQETKQAGILVESAVDIATQKSVGILDYNSHTGNRNNYFEAAIEFTQDNPQLAQILNNPDATPEQKQEAMSAFTNTIAAKFGITQEAAVLLIAENTNVRGGYAKGETAHGTIFINDTTNNNAYETTETLGHETAHSLIDHSAITAKGSDRLNEQYANILGSASSEYFAFGYSNNGLGELTAGSNNNHVGVFNLDQPNIFNQTVIANNGVYQYVKANGEVEYSTYVVMLPDGKRYQVIKSILDGDLSLYQMHNGEVIQRIGLSLTERSFIANDSENFVPSIIDPYDQSGVNFMNRVIQAPPLAPQYFWHARNGGMYDFKDIDIPENATSYEKDLHRYRAMPFTGVINYQGDASMNTYATARDVGNVAAGFMAGNTWLSWLDTRIFFDGYEATQFVRHNYNKVDSVDNAIKFIKAFPIRENPTTQAAQRIGYDLSRRK